jgi:ParB-like chromosome segregation protein Spo0J
MGERDRKIPRRKQLYYLSNRMAMIKLPINQVKANPNNPRIIKDDKFKKLVQSIKEFPEMLELRPIVVNEDMVVLGGNMRLKACKEAGLDKVPVIKASNLTEEQQKEFIIKDNVGFGEWDWNDLANNWETEKLQEWGLDIPGFEEVEEKEPDDLSDKIKSEFRIEVICKDEKEQELTYNKFIGEGYECRLLTL